MLCQDCGKRKTCKIICKQLNRDLRRFTKSQKETTYPGVNDYKNANKNLPLDNIDYHVSKWSHHELVTYFQGDHVDFPFLTSIQNNCLQLYYFEGLSYWQIARNLKKI